ncbi:MAG: carbohydrate kinase family protein [Candidatus Limnocylindria bacterium]
MAIIGDCLLDVTVAPAGPISSGGDTPASIRLAPGGQGANIAVRLARRGVSVRLVAPVGLDAAGRLVRAGLEDEGVELRALPGSGGGAVVALLAADGERTMLSDRPPFPAHFAPEVTGAVRGTAWVVCSGYALLDAIGASLAALLADRGSPRLAIAGCAVPPVSSDLADRIFAARPDLLFVNRAEASALLADDPPSEDLAELSAGLGSRFGALVIVTDPRDGSALGGGAAPLRVASSEEATPMIDATGAGDGYAAAFLAEVIGAAWPLTTDVLRRAMRAGARAGASVARVHGAQGRVSGEVPA